MKKILLLSLFLALPLSAKPLNFYDQIVTETSLKTCNLKLVEGLVQRIAKVKSKKDQKMFLSAINRNCVTNDELLALALVSGIDPTLVGDATSGGTVGSVTGITSPGSNFQSGGGTGSGSLDSASGN